MKGGEYVFLVTCDHFRSRDKDGDHTVRFAIVENPMLHASLMALFFVEPELWTCGRSKFTLQEHGFWTYSAPLTLTLTR